MSAELMTHTHRQGERRREREGMKRSSTVCISCLPVAHCALSELYGSCFSCCFSASTSVILYKLRTADILRQPIALASPSPPSPPLLSSPHATFSLFSIFISSGFFFCDSFIRLELKTHFSCHYLGLSPSSGLRLHPLSAAHCPLDEALQ